MRITNQLTSIYNLYTSGKLVALSFSATKINIIFINYNILGMKTLLIFIILYKYIVTLSLSLKDSNIANLQ